MLKRDNILLIRDSFSIPSAGKIKRVGILNYFFRVAV